MKKILPALVLISFLAVLFVPLAASAVEAIAPSECKMKREIKLSDMTCAKGSSYSLEGNESVCCLMNTLYNVTDWIFVILVGLAGIYVIIGAMRLLMAAGAPEAISSGRGYIMWAFIGLIIALLAKSIPGLVKLVGGM